MEPVTPTTEATPAGQPEAGHMIPKGRFDEVNEARKAAEALVAKFESEKEAARQEQLKAAGQFGELEKELRTKLEAAEAEKTALASKAAEYEKQQTAVREAQIAALPETHRGFASTLTPEQLTAYMVQHGGVKGPEIKPGAPGVPANTAKATPEEVAANIANPGWFAANKHRI